MLANYPAKYRDKFGEETTAIQNDGKTLRMTIRGVEFTGSMFDDFEPTIADDDVRLSLFPLHMKSLCSCVIECEIAVPVVRSGDTVEGRLHVRIELGGPDAKGGLDREEIELELAVTGKSFRSCGKHGWFEDELLEIQSKLPSDIYIESCFNCAFSDYHPVGHGAFGSLACFRNNKQEYLSLRGKAALMNLYPKLAGHVQETYLCPEFEKRVPGTGYRG